MRVSPRVRTHTCLQTIEEFLFEFGEVEGPTPDFVHCFVDESHLAALGVAMRCAPAKSAGAVSCVCARLHVTVRVFACLCVVARGWLDMCL